MLTIYNNVRMNPIVISGLGLGLWASVGVYGYLSSQIALEKCRIVQTDWLEKIGERKLLSEILLASSKNCKSPDDDGCSPEFINLVEYTLNEDIPDSIEKALSYCDREINTASTFSSDYIAETLSTASQIVLVPFLVKLATVAYRTLRSVV